MSHIFISYSRRDLDFAQRIVTTLADNNLDTWIDWKSIPKGEDWEQEIYRGIEEADAFLFLISPDSVTSEMCNKEIAHAVKNGKRILPIVIRDASSKSIHLEISKRNWIFCRESRDDFNKAIEEIRTTIHIDYEWLKFHTELQVKALKWEQQRDSSRLLRGRELREAEQQLADAGIRMDPQPTDLQRQYLLNSQRNELRTRQQITLGLVTGLIITVVLSLIAVAQRNSAIEKERIARAGELAALALSNMNGHFDLALLFGVESLKLERNSRSLNSMSSLLQSRPEIIRFLTGHASRINTITFSPDSSYIASGSCARWERGWETTCQQGEIILWDISNLPEANEITKLSEHDTGVSSIVFSPDGKVMASADWSGDVRLWDATEPSSPKMLSELLLTFPAIPIAHMAISSNGYILALAQENTVFLVDISNPSSPVELATLINHDSEENNFIPSEIVDFSFSSTGGILTCVSNDGAIVFWNITSPTAPVKITTQLIGRIDSAAFSPKGTIFASGDDDQTVTLWDISNLYALRKLSKLNAHRGTITSLVFSPDGNTLASGGEDSKLILWDVSDPLIAKEKEELTGHSNGVESIAFSPNGSIIASGDFNKTIILWNNSPESVPLQNAKLSGHSGAVNSLAYRMDGKLLASGSQDGTIKLWDFSNPIEPALISTISRNANGISSVALSPDGNLLAAGDWDFILTLWDVSDPRHPSQRSVIEEHKNIVRGVAFSPDGKTLISSGGANAFLWDISLPESPVPLARTEAYDSNMTVSPNGNYLAVGSFSTDLWDISNPSKPVKLATLPEFEGARLAFSPDNKLLAIGGCTYYLNSCVQGRIVVWDISDPSNPQEKTSLFLGTSTITSLAFSPDSKNLASGYTDGIMIWDISNLASPLQQIALSKNVETVLSLAYNPDGKSLVSGDMNGTIVSWNLDNRDPNSSPSPLSWLKIACQIAGRNFTRVEWAQFFPDEVYRATCSQWPIEPESTITPTP